MTTNPTPREAGLLSDIQISRLAQDGMITPYFGTLVRELDFPGWHLARRAISFGTSSYGYDLRLSPAEFKIFRHVPGSVVDPKAFNPANLEPAPIHHTPEGDFFILPGLSYGLGVALERLALPPDVTALLIGKSTYARCGLILNATPAEAGWTGHLTLEFSNSSAADIRIYANEGIAQALFFRGTSCAVSYADRSGKYQDQGPEVTLPRV